MNINSRLFLDGFKYSSQRKKNTRTFLSTVFSIASAIIIALLVATMLGYNPIEVGTRLFTVGIKNYKEIVNFAGALILSGLAFTMTAKAGIFNIGISGQMLGAGTCFVFIIKLFEDLGVAETIPNGAGQIIILAVAMLAGALFALIVGLLEVYLKVNSVVSAILLNWIIYFASFFLLSTYAANMSSSGELLGSIAIPDQFRLIDSNWGTGGLIPIAALVLIIAVGMLFLFKCTVLGHKITAIGLNKHASQYAGYKVNGIRLLTFAMSGSIAGILACIVYTTSIVPLIPLNTTVDAVPTEGFEGIAISLIGNNNPISIIFIGLLFGLFKSSMGGIAIPPSYFSVLIGLIMVGATISVIFTKWKPMQYWKTLKYGKSYYKVKHSYENSLNILISKYKSILKWEKQNIYNQHISSDQKARLWAQTKQEIAADYQTEIMMVHDEYQQSLWKILIDKKLIHEHEYNFITHKYASEVSMKAVKKITQLREKNYQYQMLIQNTTGTRQIKLQRMIDCNLARIWTKKQINIIKINQNEALIKTKLDNIPAKVKEKLIADINAQAKANIADAKAKGMQAYRIALWTEQSALLALKLEQANGQDMNAAKKEKLLINYKALLEKAKATNSYLNELANIEKAEDYESIKLQYVNDADNKNMPHDFAEADAYFNYQIALWNADFNKSVQSLNKHFNMTDENGVGDVCVKTIKQISKWSIASAKLAYKHAIINIKAHRYIANADMSFEKQCLDIYTQRANELKEQVAKIKNERIKASIINYLDGLTYQQTTYAQLEGGNK